MKAQVSKVLVKELNKQFKERGWNYGFNYCETGLDSYRTYINMFYADSENDWIESRGMMKYIAVIYPAEYYALPKYLTTNDLVDCFRRSDRTLNGFVNAVRREVEI